MNPHELRAMVRAEPFVPLRLYLTDGKTIDVRHPEFVQIGTRGNAVIFESDDPTSLFYDRYVTIAVLHITRAEPLETASPH